MSDILPRRGDVDGTLQARSPIRDSPEVRKTERMIIVGFDETGWPIVKTPKQIDGERLTFERSEAERTTK